MVILHFLNNTVRTQTMTLSKPCHLNERTKYLYNVLALAITEALYISGLDEETTCC